MVKIVYGLGIFVVIVLCVYFSLKKTHTPSSSRPSVSQVSQIQDLFPSSVKGIDALTETIIKRTESILGTIYAIDSDKRTFANTVIPYDESLEALMIGQAALEVLALGSPEEKLRTAAANALAQLKSYAIDSYTLNRKLYTAFVDYKELLEGAQHENINSEQHYFLEEQLKAFERSGLQLPQDQQEKVRALKKQLAHISIEFDKNIASSQGVVEVSRQDLNGLDDAFTTSLRRAQTSRYIIPVDQAIVSRVLEQCQVARTREAVYHAFMQRAYPANEKILERIRKVTHELAKILGYESYAHLQISDNMAKSPEKVATFLASLFERSCGAAKNEIAQLLEKMPPSVVLKDGKIQPWDMPFVYDYYKRNNFSLDEAKIAEYFPLEYTLPALLKVYEAFFDLKFTYLKKVQLWHEDLRVYAVYKKGHYRGTIILDLFPRPHKYSHAGFIPVVPALIDAEGRTLPGVGVLFLNFTPPQVDKPSLLKRSEVVTFFHEFGHALHSLLGPTHLASTSGTATKLDFVEMPSQMLEEWLWDPEILKEVSSHIKTGEHLSDELIGRILSSKHVGVADGILRQLCYAEFSMVYYLSDKISTANLWKSLGKKYRPYIVSDPDNKGYCSFVHLTGYGPGYYGYLWSKVFALDLFSRIKPYGLRNPEIGDRYISHILSKGGSVDPDILLRNFLERDPSPDAFFTDLGLT